MNTQVQPKYPRVTIDSLQATDIGAIHAVNNSPVTYPPGADIYITVYSGRQGEPTTVVLPLSWLPQSLTEQAARSAILDSVHFLKAVNLGMIRLISAEEYAALCASPRAEAERERLSQVKNAVETASKTEGNTAFKLELENPQDLANSSSGKNGKVHLNDFDLGEAGDDVTHNFKAWVNKMNAEGTTEESAINMVRLRQEFTNEELQYLHDKIKHGRIKSVVAKKLKEM